MILQPKKDQSGFTLIELLIGMVLGLIVMGGMIVAFSSSKSVYMTHQAMTQVQDSARLAMMFLSDDIRMAGNMGCASRFSEKAISNTLRSSTDIKYNFSEAIRGYSKSTLPDASKAFGKVPLDSSDIIALRSSVGDNIPVTRDNDSAKVFIKNTGKAERYCDENRDQISGFCPADIVVVSDCTKARVFQVTAIDSNGDEAGLLHNPGKYKPGNAISNWGSNTSNILGNYGVGAEVMLASSSIYYVAEGTYAPTSLWKNHNGTDIELLEGVERIAFRYGEDTEGLVGDSPDIYRAAKDVENWSRVVSVEVELLIASNADNVLQDPQVYTFNGEDIVSQDRRLRRVFTNTVGIRSRLN